MLVADGDKKEIIFLSVDTLKEKTNPYWTLHLDPQRASFIVNPNWVNVMVVRNTHLSVISL